MTDFYFKPSLTLSVSACGRGIKKNQAVRNICRADGGLAVRALAARLQEGILVWVVVSMMSGRREAWDSAAYFQVGILALCLVSAVMGYLAPDRSWRWGAIPLGAQMVWMLTTQGPGNLLPLGLIVGGILAIPPILTARLGASFYRRTHQAG